MFTRFRAFIAILSLALGGVVVGATPAQAADGNILPPFDLGQTWNICQGYNGGFSHNDTYSLDLTGSGCDNSASGRTVRAPLSGTVSYYQASYGNLCINTHDGRSIALVHINSPLSSGAGVNAGDAVGTVAAPGQRANNGVSHIHMQMWPSHGCWDSGQHDIPFDSAHNARICGAPDLTSSGPSNGNGIWGGTSFTGQSCGGSGIANGTYVRTASSSAIYVVAGNSAIPVPSWQSVGGEKPYVTITEQQLAAMSPYPADGTYVTDYGSPSVYVIVGGAYFSVTSWSAVGGPKATTTLPANTIGTRFRQYPLNGTYVKDYGSPSVYVVAGGAPFFVPNWESVGGAKVVAELPQGTIGTKLRQYPLNGTYVKDYGSPSVYVVAGGAGLRVTNWDAVGGPKVTTMLPESSVDTKLLPYPSNGTYVRGYSTERVYFVQDGVTTYMPNWGPSGPQPYTNVDQWAITNQLNAVE